MHLSSLLGLWCRPAASSARCAWQRPLGTCSPLRYGTLRCSKRAPSAPPPSPFAILSDTHINPSAPQDGSPVLPLVLQSALAMLSEVLRVAPGQQKGLISVLQDHCPHQRQPAAVQEAYLHGILQLAVMHPALCDDIMSISLEQCTKVDVDTRQDAASHQASTDADETQFMVELDEETDQQSAADNMDAVSNNKLDVMLSIMLDFTSLQLQVRPVPLFSLGARYEKTRLARGTPGMLWSWLTVCCLEIVVAGCSSGHRIQTAMGHLQADDTAHVSMQECAVCPLPWMLVRYTIRAAICPRDGHRGWSHLLTHSRPAEPVSPTCSPLSSFPAPLVACLCPVTRPFKSQYPSPVSCRIRQQLSGTRKVHHARVRLT